jgi:hypothetical protein
MTIEKDKNLTRIARELDTGSIDPAMGRAYAWELTSPDNGPEEVESLLGELDGCPYISSQAQQLINERKASL